jgi:hypothetical protein
MYVKIQPFYLICQHYEGYTDFYFLFLIADIKFGMDNDVNSILDKQFHLFCYFSLSLFHYYFAFQ